ncbi:uncharacterized protein LOC143072205 isoform X2 [Mytilus galloprovincialis]|uniref:uncharacterized protein LOC143072205 isoform X2 n=1 Tax=Mytilus galloprovincialis TaxID=29158 RepID=UPI003F7BB380
MGKNKRQRQKAKREGKKENENQSHDTPIKKRSNRKKRKQEHTDKSDSDRAHQKSPTRKNMDSSSLINYQQDVNGGDDSNTTENQVGLGKPKGTNAADFDNSEQGGFTDQNIKNDNISSSITHSTDQNENEPNDFIDDNNTQEQRNNGPSEIKNIAEYFVCDKEGKGVPFDLQNSAVNVLSKSLTTEQSLKAFELTNNISKDNRNTLSTSRSDIREKNRALDDLSKENTEDCKENGAGDGFINETENEKSRNGHIPKSREDLDKEITEDDTGEIGVDNGVRNQQGQSQGGFTDEESGNNTFRSLIKLDTLDNNQNEEETMEYKNNLMSDTSTGPQSEEDDHDGKKVTETLPIFNTIEEDRDKSDHEQQFIETNSCLNKAGDGIPHAPENQEKNFADINNKIANTTSTNTIKCEEQRGSTSSTPNIDSSNLGQNDQLSQMNDITVQAVSSTMLQDMDQLSSFSQKEKEGASSYDFMDDKNTPEDGINGTSEIETNSGEFFGDIQGKFVHANLNHSTANTLLTTASNEFDSSDNVNMDIINKLDTTHEEIRNVEQIKFETTNSLAEENIGNNDNGSSLNEHPVEKENRKNLNGPVHEPREELGKAAVNEKISLLEIQLDANKEDSEINVQIQQSVDETEKAFHQKLETLQQQLESVTKENGNLSECKSRLENELKFEKQELEELKERANELEREKEDRDQLENKFEEVHKELKGWKEKAAMLENQEEHKNQLEEQLLQVKDELEGWKQNNALLERQQECQQSMEETKNDLQHNLTSLQHKLESAKEDNSKLSDITESWKKSTEKAQQKLTSFELELTSVRQEKEQVVEHKNQLEEQLLQVKDELEGWKQNNALLERQQAECQQSMEVTKNDLQHNLTSLQHKLESAKEDNSKLSEGKTQLERELKTVNGQLDESREESNKLQNQNEEIQQYMEETKQSLHQELSLLQNQLDSVNQENSNIQDEKNQLVQSQQELKDELKECKSKLAMLENRKEQLNISTKVIEDTIKQQYSEIQSHLESNGNEGQDYKILSDEKDQLEEQLMQVNSELDEMKEKLVALENVKGEKDQLEQELDRMRDIASQLESMKEENERYRAQYQQINDQLRTTEQQLEQSCQECEGLSADLVRKSEKEDHYRYIETMVVTLGREKESHLKEIQELKNKVDLVEEVLISLKEEKKMKDETIKQLRADVQIKEENSHQIKRQYEAGIEQLQTMGQLRDSEIENQKREIERISSQKQQLEGNINQTSLELQTRQGDLQREQLEHNQTRNTLTQYIEAIKKMNSQVQSKDKEIEIMQGEVNKVRIESRELQLKYRDLPQKEAHFKVIENSNQYLMDENAQLQERIRSFGPFESTLHYIREENSRLSWEVHRYQERISFMEQKYRDQTCNIQQLTEEVQVFRGHRIELKRQLHQKTDEAEAVSRRLKETLEKKESLEKALLDAQEENSTYPESQTFDDSRGTEVHSFQGQRNSRGRIIRRTDIQNF